MEKSDEISSKRQKLNESACNTSEGNLNNNTVTFQRNTLIAEQQNDYLINKLTENESSDTNLRAGSEITNNYQSNPYKHEDSGNKWEEKQEEDKDKNNKEVTDNFKIRKIFPNWHIVPEVINRQIGSNPLFERQFYSSLYAVKRFELIYKLNEFIPAFINNENFFISDAKWLPWENLIAFSDIYYVIYMLDIESGISMKLAIRSGISKLAVHPEIPHVIFSAGTDSRVISIDTRENETKELFVVKTNSSKISLCSIEFNPLNSNELCVAGFSYCVMVYDRRKVSKPLYKLWPNYIINNDHVFVTSATYNYNGEEILVSYNHKDLFLFDKLTLSLGDYDHTYENYVDMSPLYNGYFFGPKSEYVISGTDNNIFIWEKNSESIIKYMRGDKTCVTHLASHPYIPMLATCGYDNNIKLWMPSNKKLSRMQSFGNHFFADPFILPMSNSKSRR
ncbi:PREDICTED: DDB1- and CUL4-associated factor 8-like [Acromyrmex echinatior]|uniref:DDB1- and CUL4-associated factor 8-like n=1 Tax=Acromyrmex echinatior TaxID=103372 RepID=UPI000580E55C|nr:PREDICTED: DDB1- and CUL4-associated factor 8-like [Acromyrmex echinatior]